MKAATACAKVDVKSSRSMKLAEPKLMAAEWRLADKAEMELSAVAAVLVKLKLELKAAIE